MVVQGLNSELTTAACLFIAVLAYLQYQRVLNVDWHKVQAISQNAMAWVADAVTHVSSNIDASHSGTLSNNEIPLLMRCARSTDEIFLKISGQMCITSVRYIWAGGLFHRPEDFGITVKYPTF